MRTCTTKIALTEQNEINNVYATFEVKQKTFIIKMRNQCMYIYFGAQFAEVELVPGVLLVEFLDVPADEGMQSASRLSSFHLQF